MVLLDTRELWFSQIRFKAYSSIKSGSMWEPVEQSILVTLKPCGSGELRVSEVENVFFRSHKSLQNFITLYHIKNSRFQILFPPKNNNKEYNLVLSIECYDFNELRKIQMNIQLLIFLLEVWCRNNTKTEGIASAMFI